MTKREKKFSIIIPSYLSHYPRCASYREKKFIRAIDSCVNQTFRNFELIIVADGCNKTMQIYEQYYKRFDFIHCYLLPKQISFSGALRNFGIDKSSGEYITYLDTDDKLGKNHLQIIADNIAEYDWAWYDDYLMNMRYLHKKITCDLKYGKCGTSNITHKRDLPVRWLQTGYSYDDWGFIQELMKHSSHAKIITPEYIVCHQPGRVDI